MRKDNLQIVCLETNKGFYWFKSYSSCEWNICDVYYEQLSLYYVNTYFNKYKKSIDSITLTSIYAIQLIYDVKAKY